MTFKRNVIAQWVLMKGSYADGVNLYCLYGDNEPLKKMLLTGPTVFNQRKLLQVMAELGEKPVREVDITSGTSAFDSTQPTPLSDLSSGDDGADAVTPFVVGDSSFVSMTKRPRELSASQPPELVAIIKERNDCYKKAGQLHAVDLVDDDQETRRKASFEILKLMKKNRECWDRVNFWERNGVLPQSGTSAPLSDRLDFSYLDGKSAANLLTLRNTNRAYISKNKGKTGRDKIAGEIKRRIAENLEIEKRVDGLSFGSAQIHRLMG
jgi:hypothetical protein